MTDNAHQAERRRPLRISTIWIVPAVAVLAGAWMIYDGIVSRGPLVTLEMNTAEGIEAGKTQIKTRNVQVGQVESVRLSEDLGHTIVEARLSAGSERMLNSGTRFWVVKPRIGREGISGLNTVLSGAYIQLLPGNTDESQRRFQVLDQPPVAPPGAQGLRLELISGVGNSLSAGDPVTYQGLTVGRVAATRFDQKNREVTHQIFIQSPYDSLVTDTTRFWTASGVRLGVDAAGVSVDFQSFETLLGGGITFGVPDGLPQGQAVDSGRSFKLYADAASARDGSFERYIEYVLLVEDTVRGLDAGAPVEYRGVRIGTVAQVPWGLTTPSGGGLADLAVPVLIHIEPRRLEGGGGQLALSEWRKRLRGMMRHGLRASLKTGNLLTGSLFVDLNFQADASAYEARDYRGRNVFPVASAGVARIQQKVVSLLDKLNALEIEETLNKLDGTLDASRTTLTRIGVAAQSAQALLDDPATQKVPSDFNQTLAKFRDTVSGYSGDSQAYQQLTSALADFDSLMQEFIPLIRTLREQPNALIFNRRDIPDPQPRAPRQ